MKDVVSESSSLSGCRGVGVSECSEGSEGSEGSEFSEGSESSERWRQCFLLPSLRGRGRG